MTNPIFFIDPDEVPEAAETSQELELGGTEGHHAATVKRISAGELVDLVDGKGLRLGCTVLSATQGVLRVRIDQRVLEAAPKPRLVLVQALAKDGRDELAIETATELGVDAIIPWQADRSIVRWKAERLPKSLAKWQKTVQAAAKQARRAWIPEVLDPVDSSKLAKLGSTAALVVLHEQASTTTAELAGLDQAEELLLIVGPEGGISERELGLFQEAGGHQLRLGPHVLRSSTAGPAAVALLSVKLGRW
ncbi:16S rRNA (uracil1498-N3)-methyltransferase [Psychromicrobium silvestre]|uniref:Ribosomal RNA small subunit methyltransferase E n=1 Tax=Psychromicrobium silvestre TaxID=1645614 RepID=A0A7Y9LRR0_9MICC|nr:16S rRNA (uracil1498-N3)-methyltransferase [Psychromicrobium silvestre]